MLTRDIAQALAGRLQGDGMLPIERLVPPDRAERPSDLALAMSGSAAATLKGSRAVAAVVSGSTPPSAGSLMAVIVVDEPRVALATLTRLFDPGPAHDAGVHSTAMVASDAVLGTDVSIGPFAVVGPRSRIGSGTVILSHVTIGSDVAIGADGLIHSGARIGDRVMIGERVIIHANAVIGADGFSYAPNLNSPMAFAPGIRATKIHSIGTVTIGDDVEIGACTTIDRSTLETTRTGTGTKIDNHVHIGHNVAIGESCIVAGMVGISGSVNIGDRVRLGGGVGIGDHVRIGDQAIVAAGSGVGSNVEPGAFVSGYPALPHRRTVEHLQYLGRQKRLHGKVDEMNLRLAALEQSVRK